MLPVVWLFGASGVGKSTTGYRLLSDLAASGVTAAFVDADQLRLAEGVSASETELIAAGLRALDGGYREHGAEVLVVAGLVDDREHLARLLPGVLRESVLTIRLDATETVLRTRIHRRGWLVDLAQEAVDHAERIAPDLADVRLDTSRTPPGDVSVRVTDAVLTHLERVSSRSGRPHGDDPLMAPSPAPERVLVLTGPGGVGVSTAGFRTYLNLASAGESVGYFDAHQLGFLGADARGDHLAPLRARNTHHGTEVMVHHRARTVVVTADPITTRELGRSWDTENVTTLWLHAPSAVLAERITSRARGGGPPIVGDHRNGLTGRALAESISAGIEESERQDLRPLGAHVVDTGGKEPAETAASILAIAEGARRP